MNKSDVLKFVLKLMLTIMFWCGLVQADVSREYQLKAAYLLNFARFIYWPEQVVVTKDSFNICVVGDSPFGDSLEKLSDKKIKNKKIKVKYTQSFKKESECNIVYISESRGSDYKEIIDNIDKHSILTVSDIEGFASSGGMIGFVRVSNRIKFEINIEKSIKSNIKYRSQLLEVADKLR